MSTGWGWFWPDWFVAVTRLRQEGLKVDPRGVPVRGSGTEVRTDLPPALFAPQTTTEGPDAGREAGDIAVYTSATLYFPGVVDLDVAPRDRLEVLKHRWVVKGDPKVYPLGVSVLIEKEEREWPTR